MMMLRKIKLYHLSYNMTLGLFANVYKHSQQKRRFMRASTSSSFHGLFNTGLRNHYFTNVMYWRTYCLHHDSSNSSSNKLNSAINEEKPVTVEKRLLNLMEMWEMDEAVELLIETLKNGIAPQSSVILNLLQQLAHLGEVENILSLHDEFLRERNLTKEVRFYSLLTEAYRNSGRFEEGVAMLRIVYHKTRDFKDTDPFFTMMTLMTLRNFDHGLSLIESFVTDLVESEPPVDTAVASLWKCLVLTERFDQADELLEKYDNIIKLIPAQVSTIVNSPFYITYNKDTVLSWLTYSPHVKTSLRGAVLESLIKCKCANLQWQSAFECLITAMTRDAPIVKQSTLTYFFTNFLDLLSEAEVNKLQEMIQTLEDLEMVEKQLSSDRKDVEVDNELKPS